MNWTPHFKKLVVTRKGNPNWSHSAFLGVVIAPLSAPGWMGRVLLPVLWRALGALSLGLWGLLLVCGGIVGLAIYLFVLMPLFGVLGRIGVDGEKV